MSEKDYFDRAEKLFNPEKIKGALEILQRIKIPLNGVELLRVVKEGQVPVFDINNNRNSKEEFLWT